MLARVAGDGRGLVHLDAHVAAAPAAPVHHRTLALAQLARDLEVGVVGVLELLHEALGIGMAALRQHHPLVGEQRRRHAHHFADRETCVAEFLLEVLARYARQRRASQA